MDQDLPVSTAAPELKSLPSVRKDLTIQAIPDAEYVVKRAASREYFSVGPQEAFLLLHFDDSYSADEIRTAFQQHFGKPLSASDLDEFIAAVRPMGLFADPDTSDGSHSTLSASFGSESSSSPKPSPKKTILQDQSLLCFRIPLFDPDESPGNLVRLVPFLWTKGFLLVAGLMVIAALSITISSGSQLAAGVASMSTWGDAI